MLEQNKTRSDRDTVSVYRFGLRSAIIKVMEQMIMEVSLIVRSKVCV